MIKLYDSKDKPIVGAKVKVIEDAGYQYVVKAKGYTNLLENAIFLS